MTPLICGAVLSEIQQIPNAIPLGIGLVQAAATLSQILERQSVTQILFTGTCGALSLPVGSIVRAKSVHLGDLSTLSGDSFIPEIMPTIAIPTQFLNLMESTIESDAFCPISITKSERGAALLQKKFPDGVVENLECFVVAQIAAQRQIPCEIILGVSNHIGPSGHEEWLSHHQEVSRKTQSWIQRNGGVGGVRKFV